MSKYNELLTGLDQNLLNNMQNYLDTMAETEEKKEPAFQTAPSLFLSSGYSYAGSVADSKQPTAVRQVIDSVDLNLSAPLLEKLLVPELNIYTHAAFLFLLEQEGLRAVRNKTPLSIVLFKIEQLSHDGNSYQQVSLPVLCESLKRIKESKREVDMLCQYENDQFAVILPDTNRAGGEIFAYKAEKSMRGIELVADLNCGSLRINLGVASSGKYCQSLESLLGATELALKKAECTENNIFVHNETILETTGPNAGECPKKMPDLRAMQLLSKEMISQEYKIFTYPAMVLRLDRELKKSFRNRRYLAIMLLKLYQRNPQGETLPLSKEILQKLMRAIRQNLHATDALGFFGDGSFMILSADSSLATMNDVAKKTISSITEANKKDCLLEPRSLEVENKILAARKNYHDPNLIDLVSV